MGEGKSHTLDNIPFVLVGGGLIKMGRLVKSKGRAAQPAVAWRTRSHKIDKFGNPNYCAAGPLTQMT